MRSRELRNRELGASVSEGTRLLWDVMRRRKWSQNQLANELEHHSGVINRWLHGLSRPGLEAANIMKLRLRIPTEAWCRSPRKPIIMDAAADG